MKTLEEIKKEYPTLTTNGWTYYSRIDDKKIEGGNILNRPKEFKAICDFLNKNIGHIKTVNTRDSSYGLKHTIERAIGHYVTNGMFIAAALACDYKMDYISDYGPNALFAMSRKDLKKYQYPNKPLTQGGPPLDRTRD
tara:strand:- start:53 stop:466 length:414 start_codon:yes stop_codon:yes gene_type:complete